MARSKGLGIPITHKIEGGYTLEEFQAALAEKFKVISTKDYPSLFKEIEQAS